MGHSKDPQPLDPPVPSGPIACEVCRREVPLSAAASSESTDYVVYFCGLECYDQWRHRPREG
jgi:hypothetical protein